MKTVTKLADITGRRWWPPLDITTILHQKSKVMKGYRLCKRNCTTLRDTYPEESDRKMSKLGNTQEEARINYLLSTEKIREKARCLRHLHPRNKGAGFNRLRIETPDVEGK